MWRPRLLFLSALAAALLFAAFYEDSRLAFTALYALILLTLASLASVLAAPSLIRLEESIEKDTVFKNEELAYTLKIVNRGLFFYPRVRYRYHGAGFIACEETFPEASVLEPRQSLSMRREISFPYRGVYLAGLERITVTDFLGLFRVTMRTKNPHSVTVYPECDDGFVLSVRNEPQNFSLNTDMFGEDYSSIADIRKYTAADSLRHIHWKLSAKRGELISKTFHSFEPNRTVLLLDTRKLPLSGADRAFVEDKMVSYAASAAIHCMNGRIPADIVYGDPETCRLEIDYSGELSRLFALLAGIRFEDEESGIYPAGRIPGACNMVLFTAYMDSSVHDAVRDLVSLEHNAILYFFHSPDILPLTEEADSLLESLSAYGVGINRTGLKPGTPRAQV